MTPPFSGTHQWHPNFQAHTSLWHPHFQAHTSVFCTHQFVQNKLVFKRSSQNKLVQNKLYTTPWYHPSAFCGLKGDSDRRKTKKKKKKKKDKNKEKFYPRRNKWTWLIQRYWLVFSESTNFFQRISLLTEIYHFKIYHFLTVFRLKNFGHVTGSPQTWYAYTFYLYPCCVQIATFHVEHFFC